MTLTITPFPTLFSVTLSATASTSLLQCASENDGALPPSGGGSSGLPPSAPPGGSDERSTPLSLLIDSLAQAVPTVRAPTLASALSGVVTAHAAFRTRAPINEIGGAMDAMTVGLSTFTGKHMEEISSTSWPLVASALYAAGLLVLLFGENSQSMSLTGDLFQATANFEAERHASASNLRTLAADQLFLCDRYLGDTLLSLKGWLQPGSLEFASQISLGRILARLGMASGAMNWPRRDVELPNLAGAVRTFFDGGAPEMFHGARLLQSMVYFQTAAGWRINSLGYLETILAGVLDGIPAERTGRLASEATKLFPNDGSIRRLHRNLSAAASREEELGAVFNELEGWFGQTSGSGAAEVSLPLFLQAARSAIH